MAAWPSWQHYPCPSWCEKIHQESDHPDDHLHASEGIAVPVLQRHYALSAIGELESRIEANTLEVGLYKREGEPLTWIFLGTNYQQGHELSVESARLLAAALEKVLQQAKE